MSGITEFKRSLKNSWKIQKRIKKTVQCSKTKPDLCYEVKELQLVDTEGKKEKEAEGVCFSNKLSLILREPLLLKVRSLDGV